MPIQIYTARDLLGVYADPRLEAPSRYWRDLCFSATPHLSTRQEIIFEKIEGSRKIAPFVLPANTGKPVFRREGSRASVFRPAFMKPKDPVLPSEQFDRQPGDLFTDRPMSPQQNFDASVAKVIAQHRGTIDRGWEWMAAQAAIYGEVTIEYESGESVLVDFDRDPNNTIIKSSGYWSDPDYPILDDIQAWGDQMAVASFGGIAKRLTVGQDVAPCIKKNKQVQAEMDLTRRGNRETDIRTGITLPGDRNDNVRYLGTVGAGIEVFQYQDFYEDDAGNQVPFMNAKDVVMTAANVDGVPAFGAIPDIDANLKAMAVFPKMFKVDDPSALFIMTQSAPLFINRFPNRTLRARPLA